MPPESRAVSLPLSHPLDWQLILLSSRIHLSVDSAPHPILSPSFSLSLTQKSVSLFVYPFVCLFVCCVTLFICLSLSSHATYFHLRPAAPPLGSSFCIYLSHLPPQLALFFQAVAYQFIFVHSHLRVLLSLIPIPIAPIRSCSPHPPLFPLFLLCNLCFTFPRTAFQLLLIGICFGLVACFDFNPVQTHFVVAMALWPWSLTRAALTLCRFIQHVYKYIQCIILVYIFNVHNTLALQGICDANVTLELYVAWP